MARILIVDDEALIAASLAFSFEAAGHEVKTANDGRRAVAMLDTFTPDVIVTDYMMPRMNGAELVRAVRSRSDLPKVRIVLSTALAADQIDAMDIRLDGFVRKPVADDEIVALVSNLVTQSPGEAM
jgi:two-component system, OmpR family, alkaline phosphatase synthesis response regulator PhoP